MSERPLRPVPALNVVDLPQTAPRPAWPVRALVLGVSSEGVLAQYDGQEWLAELATADAVEDAVGEQALLHFLPGEERPVVVGLFRALRLESESDAPVEIDAQKLLLHANRELILRCGKGSTRLIAGGRVVIDGV